MMKNAARYLILAFAVIAVIAILATWKKQDRKAAIELLEARYEATVSISEDGFFFGCSSERLVDLVEVSSVIKRVGEPTIMDLTGAPALESFAGVESFIRLESLIAIDCPKLVSTKGLKGHPSLREIVLVDSPSVADTSGISGLTMLETLDLSGCEAVTEIDVSTLSSLTNLYLSRCRQFSSLDVSAISSSLKQLYLDGCAGITSITGLEALVNLTDLDVSNASKLANLSGLASLEDLVVLDIRNVDLTDFSEIARLPSLRVLRMGGQEALSDLTPFAALPQLQEIHIEACPNLESLRGMPSTVSQYAGFTHCPKLLNLNGIEAATNLEQLDLTGCTNLEDISFLSRMEKLIQLSLVQCRSVKDISPIVTLPKLVIVMAGGSGVVPASVEGLETASSELIFDFSISE